MNRGDPVSVDLGDDDIATATYEFRVEQGEPLGHHSVMLDGNLGRRVVCGCKLRPLPRPAGEPQDKTPKSDDVLKLPA